ncbi:methylated-DNA--[protein]-cysteine S-methyltransferase [Peptacetobacter hominis]|uniref:Methylated-DNA--protein-cysteine methyltransferase n=1 Tax=Peptacetobacter hominis TaxID=2743610 RepID=A0A544QUL8_9FIRM|nr:methylated-DNA--[protein]-cysteine S-methyltransferase [Peptacetobacter hominis]TQQ84370.1 methylated-DNA--[protein]-cysteine S-methyltransferase [Peptacetobacter hominis]
MNNYYFTKDTSIGKITVEEIDEYISGIYFGDFSEISDEIYLKKNTETIENVFLQLEEYFEGKRQEFDIKILIRGTEFQKKVWNALMEIPYGKAVSYKYIAEKIGNPNASRAVGNANNKNRIMILIPCHRVISKDGKLVGYAGGLDKKKKLLEIEKINIKKRCL